MFKLIFNLVLTLPIFSQCVGTGCPGTGGSSGITGGDCSVTAGTITCPQLNGSNFRVNSSGVITTANGLATAGLGFPILVSQLVLTNFTSSTPVALLTSAPTGDYLVVLNGDAHTLCTTGNAIISLTLDWTGNSARETTSSINIGSTAANTQFNSSSTATRPIHVVSGNITFTYVVSLPCTTGTSSIDGTISVFRMN